MKYFLSVLNAISFWRTATIQPQYEFKINSYDNNNGNPGLASNTFTNGEVFYLEITAKDLRPIPLGLRGLGIKITWDPQVLENVDNPFNPIDINSPILTRSFPLWRMGYVYNDKGYIDWLQGTAFLSSNLGDVIAKNGEERFSLLKFKAKRVTQETIVSFRSRGGVGFVPARHSTSKDVRFVHATLKIV